MSSVVDLPTAALRRRDKTPRREIWGLDLKHVRLVERDRQQGRIFILGKVKTLVFAMNNLPLPRTQNQSKLNLDAVEKDGK